jgi:ATP-binding cassette subfamily B multidrug efflux pump
MEGGSIMALTNYVFQILFSLMMIGHILTSVSRCFPEFPSPPIPGRPWPSRAQQGQGNRHCFSSSCAFTTPLSGEILLDDIDIHTKDLKVLRSAISAVFQEPLLFSGTIEDNIRLGNEGASFEEVVEVAKITQIHDFILSLPEGYDTVLSEGVRKPESGTAPAPRHRPCLPQKPRNPRS